MKDKGIFKRAEEASLPYSSELTMERFKEILRELEENEEVQLTLKRLA
ncbi:MAG: hypothetical protein ACYTFW_23995 [Planctomycetota bacterium]|jgi:hypothetical protein